MSRDSDDLVAAERVKSNNPEDLHFRYCGLAKGRTFVVNVQFDASHRITAEVLRPIERPFMIARILGLILDRVAENPDQGLH